MKIGLIGCGNIGQIIADHVQKGVIGNARIIAVFDTDDEKLRIFASKFPGKVCICHSIKEFLDWGDYDVVVEAASQEAVKKYLVSIIDRGFDVMVLSVGALLDTQVYNQVLDALRKRKAHIYFPSGAICGLDGITAASLGEIKKAAITTTKPTSTLMDVPHVKKSGIELDKLKKSMTVFKGTSSDAVQLFPKNINVCAVLSLALGREVDVEIIADPKTKVNTHEIVVEGDFGRITTRTSNLPSPNNPKTSYLAALSAVRTLKNIGESIRIGT
ncbi:MAG: aspartate dehydrogenase [Candidatus Altiarchaeota archaeon]